MEKKNNLDCQYTNLLIDILENGTKKETRNGETLSIFGRQIRHDMRQGFPLLTTKRMSFKTIVTELLWFLRGHTNIKYLVDNGCHIWDGDCFSHYQKEFKKLHYHTAQMSKEEFIDRIKTDDEFAKKWGELGPIYGKQWRRWTKKKMYLSTDGSYENIYDEADQTVIDQIAILINDLKTNPDSRRLMVSAWNCSDLDQMVLPPCHYGFQVYTRELNYEERWELAKKYGHIKSDVEVPSINSVYMGINERETMNGIWNDPVTNINLPTRAISLMFNMRSVDTFLGLPFNIASYGLLLEIIAKAVNMVPDELIGNLGDVHLYSNHIEQAKEQIGRELSLDERISIACENVNMTPDQSLDWTHEVLDSTNVPTHSREPFPLPTLNINSGNENWHLLDIDDIVNSLDNDITFKLKNYQSHTTIKAPLSN